MHGTRQRQRLEPTDTEIFDQAKTHDPSDIRLSHKPTTLKTLR